MPELGQGAAEGDDGTISRLGFLAGPRGPRCPTCPRCQRCAVPSGFPPQPIPAHRSQHEQSQGPHAITRERHLRRGFTEIGQCLGKVILGLMRQQARDYAAKSAGDNRKDQAASRTSRETLALLSPPPFRGEAGRGGRLQSPPPHRPATLPHRGRTSSPSPLRGRGGVSLHSHYVAQLIPLSAWGRGTATPSRSLRNQRREAKTPPPPSCPDLIRASTTTLSAVVKCARQNAQLNRTHCGALNLRGHGRQTPVIREFAGCRRQISVWRDTDIPVQARHRPQSATGPSKCPGNRAFQSLIRINSH
jgi:hypothetical protein